MLTSCVFFILSHHISPMLCKSVNIVSSKRAQVITYGKFFYGLHFFNKKSCIEHRQRNKRTGFAREGELEETRGILMWPKSVLMQPPPEEGISVSPHAFRFHFV